MNFTPIFEALVTLIVAILTCFLIPMIQAKMTAEQLSTAKMWVAVAVNAAEQLYIGTGKGAEKKAYVIEFLKGKGINLDEDSIDKMIEAAVLELKIALDIENK